MINKIALALIFFTGGILVLAALFNWKIFISNTKGNYFSEKWGYKAARVFYGLLGCTIIILGIYALYNGFLEDVYQ